MEAGSRKPNPRATASGFIPPAHAGDLLHLDQNRRPTAPGQQNLSVDLCMAAAVSSFRPTSVLRLLFYAAALLLMMSCPSGALDPETCFSRQHQGVTVNIRRVLNRPDTARSARVVRSERDCVLACCSDQFRPGARCNMAVFKVSKHAGENNCFLLFCQSELDCPLMKAVDGSNTYNIYKGLAYPPTGSPFPMTTSSTQNTTPALMTTGRTGEVPSTIPAEVASSLLPSTGRVSAAGASPRLSIRKPNRTNKKLNKTSKKGKLNQASSTGPPLSSETPLRQETTRKEGELRASNSPEGRTEPTSLTTASRATSATTSFPPVLSRKEVELKTSKSPEKLTEPTCTNTPASPTNATSTPSSPTTTTDTTHPTRTIPPNTQPTRTITPTTHLTRTIPPNTQPTRTNTPATHPTRTITTNTQPTGTIAPTTHPTGTLMPNTQPTGTIKPNTHPTRTVTPTTHPTRTVKSTTQPTRTSTTPTRPTRTITPTTRTPSQGVMFTAKDIHHFEPFPQPGPAPVAPQGPLRSGVVVLVVLGLALLMLALAAGGRKAMESFDRRHYTRLELNDLHYEI